MTPLISSFPKKHALVACFLAVPLMSFLVTEPQGPKASSFASLAVTTIPIPRLADVAPASDGDVGGRSVDLEPIPETPPPPALPEGSVERREIVKGGDSLARIFKRLSLPPTDLHHILQTGEAGERLKRIFPGQELLFVTSSNHEVLRLTYSPSRLERVQFERGPEGFTSDQIVREPERVTSYRHGTIDQSLFVATHRLGLDDDVAMRLAQIFQWDIDFVLDIRKGDEFYLLFEEHYIDDEFIGVGRILAAEFVNQGETFKAILYTNANGDVNYYSPDGESMRKAFLRAPVQFTRISSNFNPRRLHPIHKRVMPHRGIDYAAPAGTPVLAAGDGRVKTASRNNASGNFMVVQHGEQFQTKYLHLSKFARGIGAGKKVRQGQVIGYVGATGWATAPHLHYEFLVNGHHQNPRTVSLPKADPIQPAERVRFTTYATPLLALLDSYKEQVDVASIQ